MKCSKSAHTPNDGESQCLFPDHTTGLQHRIDRSAGSAAMEMETSVTGSIHTWQHFLCCDALCIQWRLEHPEDSPLVSQETEHIWFETCRTRKRHAPDLSSYILFTDWAGEREWIRAGSNTELAHSLARSSCPREQSDSVCGQVFTHSAISLTDTETVICQSRRLGGLLKEQAVEGRAADSLHVTSNVPVVFFGAPLSLDRFFIFNYGVQNISSFHRHIFGCFLNEHTDDRYNIANHIHSSECHPCSHYTTTSSNHVQGCCVNKNQYISSPTWYMYMPGTETS